MDLETIDFACGYCGETSSITVDPSGGASQSYVEDCPVCCRPNRVDVSLDPDTLEVLDVSVTYEG
jgi:hypothetical protein